MKILTLSHPRLWTHQVISPNQDWLSRGTELRCTVTTSSCLSSPARSHTIISLVWGPTNECTRILSQRKALSAVVPTQTSFKGFHEVISFFRGNLVLVWGIWHLHRAWGSPAVLDVLHGWTPANACSATLASCLAHSSTSNIHMQGQWTSVHVCLSLFFKSTILLYELSLIFQAAASCSSCWGGRGSCQQTQTWPSDSYSKHSGKAHF